MVLVDGGVRQSLHLVAVIAAVFAPSSSPVAEVFARGACPPRWAQAADILAAGPLADGLRRDLSREAS